MDKQAIRDEALAWRATLDPAAFSADVRAAVAHLLAAPEWSGAKTVALYAALPGEPDLTSLVEDAWARGVRVALPVVIRKATPLLWRAHRPEVALQRGRFRVPVPPPDAPEVDPAEIDLVVVPALAVDDLGYRIGYGGGYYDRSLPHMPGAFRVWIGLPRQRIPRVPRDATDQPVHACCTPDGLDHLG